MRSTRLFVPAVLLAALAGCVDEPVSTLQPGDARVVVASDFSFAGSAAGLPIELVRLTPTFQGGGSAGEPREVPVDSNDDEFVVDAWIDMGGRDSATVIVLVELLSTGSGEEVVEWSGLVGPVIVHADEQTTSQTLVTMIRGPIENLGVFGISVFGPSALTLGQSHQVMASVSTEGTDHQVIWASSDPTVVMVDPIVGDTIDIFALAQGTAWIVGAAGSHADSFMVTVTGTGGGAVAGVFVFPDSAVMVPGSTRQWQAYALDENEDPTFPTFTWTSLDESIATVGSTGLVSAHQLGRARIVVSAEGFADTAIVNVQSLPEGVDIMWQGGTFGAESDWFTADNWSPARVPTPTDVVYIPGGSSFVVLDGDTEIGGLIADTLGGYSMHLAGASTLTIHGDMLGITSGDAESLIVLDSPGAQVFGYVQNISILTDIDLVNDLLVFGELTATNAHLNIGDEFGIFVLGDMTANNTSVTMALDDTTFSEGALYVAGDLLIDGGDWSTGITGGYIDLGGDLTVTAVCGAFAPQGGQFEMVSDTSVISIGCAGPTNNRFNDLWIYRGSATQGGVELTSDVYVTGELYIDGFDSTVVAGNGHTLQARYGSAYNTTFDHTFIEVASVSPDDYFSTDNIVITGMTGETRPQVRYFHPGTACFGCYGPIDVHFDPTSAGPYIEVTDTELNGDSVIVYMENNPGDGPARTVVNGEAAVHWADVPVHLIYWSGSSQSGTQHQPLPDSLIAQVLDYAFFSVAGVTVEWTVVSGDGTVSPATDVSDAAGIVKTEFTVGDTIFFSQEVMATSDAVPQDTVFYTAFPTPAPPAGVSVRAAPQPIAPVERPMPARRQREERRALPVAPDRTDAPTTGRSR